MKLVKLMFAAFLILAASVCELSAQNSSSASQTVAFGVRRMMPALLAGLQLTAMTVNELRGVPQGELKVTVGSNMDSNHVADAHFSRSSYRSAALDRYSPARAPLVQTKFAKPTSGKVFITVTE